ncbi:MAG: hypothetical protein MUF34_03985 [Polyangiaceae bacterium]|nr:hypothetical protein [Polyangiaceae bacterium]
MRGAIGRGAAAIPWQSGGVRPAAYRPALHYFVCVNRRDASDPLGPGCGASGQSLWQALRSAVAERGLLARVWVTRSQCLGLCPKQGAAVACYPPGQIWVDAVVADVEALLSAPRGQAPNGGAHGSP